MILGSIFQQVADSPTTSPSITPTIAPTTVPTATPVEGINILTSNWAGVLVAVSLMLLLLL